MPKRMSLTDTRYKTLKSWLRAVIKAVVAAEIADDRKGGTDPADWPAVEAELRRAKAELRDVLAAIDDVVDRDLRARFPV